MVGWVGAAALATIGGLASPGSKLRQVPLLVIISAAAIFAGWRLCHRRESKIVSDVRVKDDTEDTEISLDSATVCASTGGKVFPRDSPSGEGDSLQSEFPLNAGLEEGTQCAIVRSRVISNDESPTTILTTDIRSLPTTTLKTIRVATALKEPGDSSMPCVDAGLSDIREATLNMRIGSIDVHDGVAVENPFSISDDPQGRLVKRSQESSSPTCEVKNVHAQVRRNDIHHGIPLPSIDDKPHEGMVTESVQKVEAKELYAVVRHNFLKPILESSEDLRSPILLTISECIVGSHTGEARDESEKLPPPGSHKKDIADCRPSLTVPCEQEVLRQVDEAASFRSKPSTEQQRISNEHYGENCLEDSLTAVATVGTVDNVASELMLSDNILETALSQSPLKFTSARIMETSTASTAVKFPSLDNLENENKGRVSPSADASCEAQSSTPVKRVIHEEPMCATSIATSWMFNVDYPGFPDDSRLEALSEVSKQVHLSSDSNEFDSGSEQCFSESCHQVSGQLDNWSEESERYNEVCGQPESRCGSEEFSRSGNHLYGRSEFHRTSEVFSENIKDLSGHQSESRLLEGGYDELLRSHNHMCRTSESHPVEFDLEGISVHGNLVYRQSEAYPIELNSTAFSESHDQVNGAFVDTCSEFLEERSDQTYRQCERPEDQESRPGNHAFEALADNTNQVHRPSESVQSNATAMEGTTMGSDKSKYAQEEYLDRLRVYDGYLSHPRISARMRSQVARAKAALAKFYEYDDAR